MIDGIGVELLFLDVIIILCGGCGSYGCCDYDDVIFIDNVCYSLVVCLCEKGYFGMRMCFEID